MGGVSANISRITDKMLQVASETLAAHSPLANSGDGELLPPLTDIAQLSKEIAFEIGKVAFEQKLALKISDEKLRAKIEKSFWQAEYREYRRVST